MNIFDDLRVPSDRKWGGENRKKYLSKIKKQIPILEHHRKLSLDIKTVSTIFLLAVPCFCLSKL